LDPVSSDVENAQLEFVADMIKRGTLPPNCLEGIDERYEELLRQRDEKRARRAAIEAQYDAEAKRRIAEAERHQCIIC
jgi:hypothetical protein